MSARRRLPKRKGPPCTVCVHKHRALIEATRIAGASLDNIAARYGVSRDAVHRHCRPIGGHISDELRSDYLAQVPLKELAEKAAAEGLTVIDYLSLIRATLVQQMQLAASVNDRNGTAIIARTLNETLRQIASITGEMGTLAAKNITINGNVNMLASPVWMDMRGTLMKALRPYPEAARAVAAALHDIEARDHVQPASALIDVSRQIDGVAHAV